MKNYSLRRRLILWISAPIVFLMAVALISSYQFARHEIEEVYDAQLAHAAKVLLQITEREILEKDNFQLGEENSNLQHLYEQNLGFRIWSKDRLVTSSPNTESFLGIALPAGFSNQIIAGYEWRFFVYDVPEYNIRVEVSERYDIRYEIIIQLMASVTLPIILMIPVIFFLISLAVRGVLRPVIRISHIVDRRSSDDLSPIEPTSLPEEIAPIIFALNALLVRLEESFRSEREFTDHAAHELRTPLAAMKTQTQVLLKRAAKMPELSEGLDNLQASINRATHLVEQLLSLARLQHEQIPKATFDLSEILLERVRDFQQRANKKGIALRKDIHRPYMIKAHAESVAILLDNLLENAVKYTPEDGQVFVSLSEDGQLIIVDSGPGLTDTDKVRVFERFVRADKTGQSGSGLGLSIVQWIAAAHDIEISLRDNDPTGLSVHLHLPSAS